METYRQSRELLHEELDRLLKFSFFENIFTRSTSAKITFIVRLIAYCMVL
jgi:hypothetical protein